MSPKTLLVSSILAGSLAFSTGSIGATVTLNPSGVSGPNTTTVPENFGDTSDVNFTWSVNGVDMLRRTGGFSDEDAFYCGTNIGAVCTFDIAPLGGASLTLDSFDLGGFSNADPTIQWSIFDLSNVGTSVLSGTAEVPGDSPLGVIAGLPSTAGFRVSFGPDGFNAGLTALTYTITPVPLPAAGWLFLSGLTALGGLAWRRNHQRIV